MQRPVLMTPIDDLPVSVYDDGSVELVDQNSGAPVTLTWTDPPFFSGVDVLARGARIR
jgi:hypothetical protein